jgi:3-hydroxy-3-methylglutaryl CoA synthase
VLLWPGLQLQRMTTAEPDDDMVEVAVAAVRPVIAREDREEGRAPAEATSSESAVDEVVEPASEPLAEPAPEPVTGATAPA